MKMESSYLAVFIALISLFSGCSDHNKTVSHSEIGSRQLLKCIQDGLVKNAQVRDQCFGMPGIESRDCMYDFSEKRMNEYMLLEQAEYYRGWRQLIDEQGTRMIEEEGMGLNIIYSTNINKMDRALLNTCLLKHGGTFFC